MAIYGPEYWKKLLYNSIGKITIEWIKSQNVDLGEFKEEDYKKYKKSIGEKEKALKIFNLNFDSLNPLKVLNLPSI